MSIVTMKKATLIGAMEEKSKTLLALQDFGLLHVTPLIPGGKPQSLSCDKLNEAIKHLTDTDEKAIVQHHPDNFDADAFAEKVLANKNEIDAIHRHHKELYHYLETIREWGDFEIPSSDDLNGHMLYFFKMTEKKMRRLKLGKTLAWQCVHIADGVAYVVVVAPLNIEPQIAGATRVDFADKNYNQALAAFEKTDKQLQENHKKRVELTAYLDALMRYKDKLSDALEFDFVSDYSWNKEGIYIVQGWIAGGDIEALQQFAAKHAMAVTIEEPTEDDNPPTLLLNSMVGAPGEELVKFYQMPSYRMWDPSTVMFFSFALFFAMIMSDFGYGVLMSIITAVTWKKMRTSELGRRMRRMLMVLSGSCLVYGVLCGSYFGYEAPIDVLRKFDVVDIENFDSMIKLSVGIGALHIILANIIRFMQALPRWSALSFVGWILMVAGGFSLYALGQDIVWAQGVLIAGLATVFLFSSDRPLKGLKNILLRPVEGLLGLTNITKAFGDCLSYIRLFALGLSSALLATSFNSMAQQAMDTDTIFGIGLGVVVLIFGHLLNLVLGIIGGLVHGLRLNFIEFSNWGLSGEGYPFKPFELKEKRKWKL